MNKQEAREKIHDIVVKIVYLDDKYVMDKKYIRWNKVEKDLIAIIDELDKEAQP